MGAVSIEQYLGCIQPLCVLTARAISLTFEYESTRVMYAGVERSAFCVLVPKNAFFPSLLFLSHYFFLKRDVSLHHLYVTVYYRTISRIGSLYPAKRPSRHAKARECRHSLIKRLCAWKCVCIAARIFGYFDVLLRISVESAGHWHISIGYTGCFT